MTTGDGKAFSALSVTPVMVCAAPDVTITSRVPGALAAREMICAWAESSRALSTETAHRARKAILYLANCIVARSLGLLDDRLKIQGAQVVTCQSGRACQIETEIQLIRAGPEVVDRSHALAEQLQASTSDTHATQRCTGERRVCSGTNPA